MCMYIYLIPPRPHDSVASAASRPALLEHAGICLHHSETYLDHLSTAAAFPLTDQPSHHATLPPPHS